MRHPAAGREVIIFILYKHDRHPDSMGGHPGMADHSRSTCLKVILNERKRVKDLLIPEPDRDKKLQFHFLVST